jgi:transcriptional regulator with XRE-family HTH domain
MDVGQRIAAWRGARGLTQQQLAKAVGVTHAAVYQWETAKASSKTRPSLEKLEKVVQVFKVTMERFYGPIPRSKTKRAA